jgi:hypothetical protein
VFTRQAVFATVLFGFLTPSFAQSVKLGEQVKPGDHFQYDLQLLVEGTMKVDRNGKVYPLTLKGEATHTFAERVESVDSRGGVAKAIRYYTQAKSSSSVGGDSSKRALSDDRRLTVAVRTDSNTVHVCPNGPFTREELELVGEHFDTLNIPALLPNKELKSGEGWDVPNDAAQFACQFEGLLKNELKGTLTGVREGIATFTLTGQTEGIALGAVVKVTVKASGTFDIATSRVTSLSWEQSDEREQGPVSPTSEVKATVTVRRTSLAEQPKELSAEARSRVPADKIPDEMTRLRLADPDGKYTVTYSRDWIVVGRTADHLVMRLMHKGEFATQATISLWKKVGKGQHTPVAEFKDTLAKLTNWQPGEVLADADQTSTDGRWTYRYSVRGKQDGADVVQTFYLLAGPAGDQVAVTFLSTPDKAAKYIAREAELLSGIGFVERK